MANTFKEWQDISDSYAAWLQKVESLDLLEVFDLKPIVNGTKLCEALGQKGGVWTKDALNMVIDWQLRNPSEVAPSGAIAEVLERKSELNLPK